MALKLSSQILRRAHTPSKDINLKGIFIPLTTPFKENEEICYESLKKNLQEYEKIPFTGYVVAGSNGEAPYLNPDERIDLVKFIRNNTHDSKVVIGGSTAESTKTTCWLTKKMGEAGADGVLVMPPFYFKKRMTEEALVSHYTTVADKCGLPIVIYNMPVVTGLDLSTSTLVKLAEHPKIRGVKDSDIRKCAATFQDSQNLNFDVLIGSAGYLLPALMNGCSGGINGLAGILGKELCQIYQYFNQKKFIEAGKIQLNIAKPDILLLAELGVPGLKFAMDIKGLTGGLCRKPILPLGSADKEKIKQILQQYLKKKISQSSH